MELKIRRDSNFTIHIQLKEQIKGLILNNILENGTQLPTVRGLASFRWFQSFPDEVILTI